MALALSTNSGLRREKPVKTANELLEESRCIRAVMNELKEQQKALRDRIRTLKELSDRLVVQSKAARKERHVHRSESEKLRS